MAFYHDSTLLASLCEASLLPLALLHSLICIHKYSCSDLNFKQIKLEQAQKECNRMNNSGGVNFEDENIIYLLMQEFIAHVFTSLCFFFLKGMPQTVFWKETVFVRCT